MKTLKRIFSFAMAIFFLMATTGFSVYEHYCGENLVDKSIYSSTTSCTPDHKEDDCSSTANKDCCTEQFQFLQLDVELKNPDWNRKSVYLGFFTIPTSPAFNVHQEPIDDNYDFDYSEIPIDRKSEPFYILQQQLVYYG